MYAYSIILEGLYELARKKAPEVLPKLEELVEETGAGTFDTQLLSTIRDYIIDYIPPSEHNNTYKQKIQNLEKGLEQLLKPDVQHKLFELYWGIRSREFTPPDSNFYLNWIRDFAYFTDQRLDRRTIRMHAQEEAAYNYLYSHIKCLLSNPDGYVQHMKAGDLEAFIKSCKP